jgi:hypothetical protein
MSYYNGDRRIPMDAAFTLNGLQYPANWLRVSSKSDKEKAGLEWKPAPELKFKDKRWYNNRVVDGEVKSEPKDLDGLKEKMLRDLKHSVHAKLSQSDWMVIREAEVSTPVEEDWSSWRDAVRDECDRQEVQIGSATGIESLAAIVSNWPESPDDKVRREKREAEIAAANERQ